MPALPFDPADLATALPDVAWAVGIAFILALVTFKAPRPEDPPTMEDALSAMGASDVLIAEIIDADGS
jgi:hypothetical protein